MQMKIRTEQRKNLTILVSHRQLKRIYNTIVKVISVIVKYITATKIQLPILKKEKMNLNYSEIVDVQINRKSNRVFIKRILRFQESTALVVGTLNLKDTLVALYDDLETWSNHSFTESDFTIGYGKLIDS